MSELESRKIVYTETCNSYRYFIDWRHRVLTRYFIFLSAIGLLVKWLHENHGTKELVPVAFVFIAVFSIFFYILEERNDQLIKACGKNAMEMEKLLHTPGYFCEIYDNDAIEKRNFVTYEKILKIIYGLGVLLSILLAIFL